MPKILIIDDDPDLRKAYSLICNKQGWEVESAADGTEGLTILQQGGKPDLILLDVLMPGMGGIDLLAKVKEINLQLPPTVVFTNSQVPADTNKRAKELGASRYLAKNDLDPDTLVDLIKSLLSGKS